jgi:hypothetical protein
LEYYQRQVVLSHAELARLQFALVTLIIVWRILKNADSGWPCAFRRFAAEVCQRANMGELADEELYCCDAQWSGLYDRMHTHESDEMERRLALAADYGEPLSNA